MNRRNFLTTGITGLAGITFIPSSFYVMKKTEYQSKRPALKDRTFVSDAVESFISEVKNDISDPELAWMFENCFPNTLDTTIKTGLFDGRPDTFVITGDIPAMWLRDSTAQVWPYLPLANEDRKLKDLLKGVVNRQTACILLDPYANAFLYDKNEKSQWVTDITEMRPGVHERKFELDSLCYAIRLSHGYWKATGDGSVFDENWKKAMKLVLEVFRKQQKKDGNNPDYTFMRNSVIPHETLANNGNGRFVNPVGLICSPFRPSDDATTFQFLIPSNYFAVKSLTDLHEIYSEFYPGAEELGQIDRLKINIEEALKKYGSTKTEGSFSIIPYETDAFGSVLIQDEPNIPNLLSLPYLGCMDKNDPLYLNTRKFVLSLRNPYFLRGKAAEGLGSPHTPVTYIWHLGILMRALTSDHAEEVKKCLTMLKNSHAGTGFMHEGFDKDNPSMYTRDWFSWANSLFGELIVRVRKDMPELLKS